ncbi:MAG: sigma 54-interacting transcriptional regulator [Rhodospirillaceae bacterium]
MNAGILTTSNRNMEAEVKAGNFCEDLYFRLNVVSIAIPSLRDRPRDGRFSINTSLKNTLKKMISRFNLSTMRR